MVCMAYNRKILACCAHGIVIFVKRWNNRRLSLVHVDKVGSGIVIGHLRLAIALTAPHVSKRLESVAVLLLPTRQTRRIILLSVILPF